MGDFDGCCDGLEVGDEEGFCLVYDMFRFLKGSVIIVKFGNSQKYTCSNLR